MWWQPQSMAGCLNWLSINSRKKDVERKIQNPTLKAASFHKVQSEICNSEKEDEFIDQQAR